DEGGVREPLRDGHHPACEKRCTISGRLGDHRTERSARLAVGACEGLRRDRGVGIEETRAPAHRRGGWSRYRLHQDANGPPYRGLDQLHLLAGWPSRLATDARQQRARGEIIRTTAGTSGKRR